MSPGEPSRDLDLLERAWALPSNATPLQRALAYRPSCGPAWIHCNSVIAKLCRELGMRPPWSLNLPPDRWPASWTALRPWQTNAD